MLQSCSSGPEQRQRKEDEETDEGIRTSKEGAGWWNKGSFVEEKF